MGQASASVRELKSKLSHYLRLTKVGESVVITERGVPTYDGELWKGAKTSGRAVWPSALR